MKLKHLLIASVALLSGVNAMAKEDVTSKLNDAALANESNWALVSNGGNHTAATNGYHESWHNTFSLTQTVKDLPAGYYRLSIQAVVENNFSNTISLTATSGSNTSVAAHPVYTCAGSYADMAAWWAADATATGNANLNRIYTTVKVEEGQDLVCRFEQTSNAQWMVYGQFRLESLTESEGKAAQKFEAVYNNKAELQNMATGRFKQRFEDFTGGLVAAGSEKLTKTYTGLPNGKYTVTINGSASTTGSRDNFNVVTGNDLTVFFANTVTTNVPVVSRTNVGNNEFGDYTVENVMVVDGTLKVGYRILSEGANWFTGSVKSIEYLGVDLSDFEDAYSKAYTGAVSINQSIPMNADVLAALQTVISTYAVEFSTFTEAEEVLTAINALNQAADDVHASISYYEAVQSVIDEQAAIVANYDEAGKAAYNVAAVQTAYDNRSITDGAAEIAMLKSALQTAVRAQGVGGDYTVALANPDFKTDDLTGWNMNGKAAPAVDVANHDCEFYEKTFDMSQTVSNLKKGTYEISFQAFQRPGAANNDLATNFVNENWTSCATLYTTAQETAVKHICEDWQDAAQSDVTGWQADSRVTPAEGTEHYIPNSMPGGRQWFDKGYYVTTAKAVVLEDGGSLTFGFRGQQPASSWILFDNFTLTYFSEDVLIDEAESDKLLASAEALQSQTMTADVKSALTDALNALSSDKTNGSKYNDLQAAVVAAQESADAYSALNSALTGEAFVDRSAAFASEFTYRAEAQEMYNAATAATADVNAKVAGMLNAYRDYVRAIAESYPATAAIKWSTSGDGWSYDTGASNHGQLNNPVNKDVAANSMWENYKNGGLTVGDMKQIVNVPNGKYFLRMASFTRNSINENDYIYIKSGETTETALSLGEAASKNAFINITNPIEVTNGLVEIGLHIGSGADWAAIGGVELHVYSVDDYARATVAEKCGTICLPYAATVEGAKVYSAAVNGDYVTLTEVGTELEACVPYIYQAEAGAQTFAYASGNIKDEASVAGPLHGVFTPTEVPVGSYVMQTHDGEQQFYLVTEGNQPTLSAYKAYLTVPAPKTARLRINYGDATGINALNALVNGDAKIYDLNGRQLNALQKGINIVNGAKVIVK